MLHIFNPIRLFYFEGLSERELALCYIFGDLFGWAVPVFFMISGNLLLPKEITYTKVFKKYVPRMLTVLIIFAFPFALMEVVFDKKGFSPLDLLEGLRRTFSGESWGHLWYLYTLIGIYLVLPVLRFPSIKENIFIVLVLFVYHISFPVIKSLTGLEAGFKPLFASYLMYFFLGSLFRQIEVSSRMFICAVISLCVIPVLSFLLWAFSPNLVTSFLQVFSPLLIFLLAGSIFLISKRINKAGKAIVFLSGLTFSIYIIHPLFCNIVFKVIKICPPYKSFSFTLLVAFIVIPLGSLVLSIFMKRLPILKRFL